MRQRAFADISGPTTSGAAGIARSHNHAENDEPGWTEAAALELARFAQTVHDFTIEQARAAITVTVGAPDELRAWGAVTQYAQRRGWIERTDRYRSTTSSHGSPKPVYQAPDHA